MSDRPRLTSLDLWGSYERLCSQLLREALEMLAGDSTGESENDLNRGLYRAIIRVSRDAAMRGESPPAVVPEGHNPPSGSDQERAEREFKIPDFYWAYIDPLTEDPDEAAKQFVVECKRLTKPTRSWVYTREYVKSGVARFISVGHGYGKGMASGAMVGYLQEILLDDALQEINAIAGADSIPPLAVNARNGETTAEFDHNLVRSFPESPFRLMHIWTRIEA